MKIIFMGTPNFALKSLIALNKNFDVQLVVTQPDKPVGRKKQIILSPVKEYCIGKNLNCIQPKTIKNNQELLDTLRKKNPDIICVAAYGKILSKEILEIPKNDAFRQYVAYHEGWGNYKNYKNKQKIILLAKKVENQSKKYKSQLNKCKNSLTTRKYILF